MSIILKHFWVLIALGTWFTAYLWREAVQYRIKHQPNLMTGYDDLYKGFLFWCNVPWILMGFLILTGQAHSVMDFFPPGSKENPSALIWHGAMVLLNLIFLNWITLKNGAEILEKYPGIAFIPQWPAKRIRYFSMGIVLWNLIILYFFYHGGPDFLNESSAGSSPDFEQLWVLFFPVIFVGMWTLISYMIATMGGWDTLATLYPCNSKFKGKLFRFSSGRFGAMAGYGSCLTLGSNPQGLYLAVWFPFRIGHPPLFIPWSDITAHNKKLLFFPSVELEFSKSPGNIFRISKSLAEKIAKESDGHLKI